MIKSFSKFNEAILTPYFEESEDFETILSKHEIDDDEMSDFFLDLSDERDITFRKLGGDSISDIKENEFKIHTYILFEKSYKNQKRTKANHINTSDYLNFLQAQSEDIKIVTEYCQRFAEKENLKLSVNEISQIPFQGAGSNTKDSGKLCIYLSFVKTIMTSEMYKSKTAFSLKDNPFKRALSEVAKKISRYGVRIEDAKSLLDIHPGYEEMEDVDIGFSTNDEIISVAYLNKSTGKIRYVEDNMAKAVEEYEAGYCSDFL